jgi:sugar-specific transcriptional regulator TrmB
MDFQEQVETLTRLGLTINQSKIFIALAQSKPATVTQIAKSANLAREVVYRTLPKLERTGLVSKVISFPTEFKAISIDLATRILLEKRAKNHRSSFFLILIRLPLQYFSILVLLAIPTFRFSLLSFLR